MFPKRERERDTHTQRARAKIRHDSEKRTRDKRKQKSSSIAAVFPLRNPAPLAQTILETFGTQVRGLSAGCVAVLRDLLNKNAASRLGSRARRRKTPRLLDARKDAPVLLTCALFSCAFSKKKTSSKNTTKLSTVFQARGTARTRSRCTAFLPWSTSRRSSRNKSSRRSRPSSRITTSSRARWTGPAS